MEKYFTLSNGKKIPAIGYGTWQTPDGKTAEDSVAYALTHGYTHVDGAAAYGNEKSVGAGIKKSGVKREDIFVTSKVWNADRGYDKTIAACHKTLSDLGLDYLDLYLIHWPANEKQFADWKEINVSTWKAMIDLYKEGLVKAIGVSNFYPHHLEPLMDMEITPMVSQIEYHPGFTQPEVVSWCREHGMVIEAWSPLGSGRVLKDERLGAIAASYGKSTAQLCVRYALQNNVLPLPKSVTPERIDQNKDVWDFVISDEDMQKINNIGELGASGLNADEVDF